MKSEKTIKAKKTKNTLKQLGLITTFFLSLCCAKAPKPNHNVIMIVSDACRKDILGCYGGTANTPNIDRLARQGILFEKAYSTAPCTMPSSIAMFTGNYSRSYIAVVSEGKNISFTHYVNDDEKLLGEMIKEEMGYDVRMDYENGLASRANSLQGFKKIRQMNNMDEEEIELVENITGLINIGQNEDSHLSSRYDKLYGMLHYLMTVPDEQNFFLLKWFADPHAPYHPPQKFRERIAFNTSTLPKEESHYSSMFQTRKTTSLTQEECDYLKELYQAEVESMDERVGFIIKALEFRDLLKETYIIFTADHGEFLGEHGRLLHGNSFFEPVLNVPLIIAGPKIPRGKKVNAAVSLVDLVPTLKGMLHLEYSSLTQGESFYPLLTGDPFQSRAIYFDRIKNKIEDINVHSDALLMNGYKLIALNRKNKPVYALYNLADDPDELKDISENHPEIVRKMFQKILEFRMDCNERMKQNLMKMDEKIDLDQEAQKTLEMLKSLGYIK
jgi:arylsulfatase A-like enzyme